MRAAKRIDAKARANEAEKETNSFKNKAKNAKAKASAYFICSTQKTSEIRTPVTPFQFAPRRKKASFVGLRVAVVDVSLSKTKFRNFTNVNGKRYRYSQGHRFTSSQVQKELEKDKLLLSY